MLVTIPSWAPVTALRPPTIQPIAAPPANAPSRQTMTWITGGRLTPKPSQVPTMAPPMNWLVAPQLNSPARNAMAHDRAARIRGVSLDAVPDRRVGPAAAGPPEKPGARHICRQRAAPGPGLK